MEQEQKQTSVEQFAPDQSKFSLPQQSKFNQVKNRFNFGKKKILIILAIIVALGALGYGTKAILDLRSAKKELEAIKNDPNAKAKEDSRKLVEEVGKLVILPEGEEPTIATVTDPSKLADQPFFANAKPGDKVLIYQEASRAILYRPDDKKVIEIAPLTLGGETSLQDQAQQVQQVQQQEGQQPAQ